MNATTNSATREYFATPGAHVTEEAEIGGAMLYLTSQNGVTEWESCFFFGSRDEASKVRQVAESAISLADQLNKPVKFEV